MQVKQHTLARPMKYYSTTEFKYRWMLDQLPVEHWLELSHEFTKEHKHASDLYLQEFHNYEDTTFEFSTPTLTPRFCTYCGSDLSLPAGCHACWSDEE